MANLMKAVPAPDSPPSAVPADPEVVAVAHRRQFSRGDKRRILAAADHCTKPGEIGALLRREGIYSSLLASWRKQRAADEVGRPGCSQAWRKARSGDCGGPPHG